MQLPLFQSPDQSFMLLQQKWKSILDPVLAIAFLNGVLQTNITLSTGDNTINHLLGRNYRGWFLTGMHSAFAQVYDKTSTNPSQTLILNASGATTVDLYVF